MISTFGNIGRPGKCPAKDGAVYVMHFTPRADLRGWSSITRSSRRNGDRCGRIRRIRSTSSSTGGILPIVATDRQGVVDELDELDEPDEPAAPAAPPARFVARAPPPPPTAAPPVPPPPPPPPPSAAPSPSRPSPAL